MRLGRSVLEDSAIAGDERVIVPPNVWCSVLEYSAPPRPVLSRWRAISVALQCAHGWSVPALVLPAHRSVTVTQGVRTHSMQVPDAL